MNQGYPQQGNMMNQGYPQQGNMMNQGYPQQSSMMNQETVELDRKADGDGQQGRQGGGRQTQRRHSADYEDLGPAFPSEASGLDDVPF